MNAVEIEELVSWTRKPLDEESFHPLLVVAVFVVTCVAIHPFQDGNGRLSRVRVIEENKDLYYKALRRTQTTLKNEATDREPWIGFFLRCLKKQKDWLALRLERERGIQGSETDLPELSLQVVKALKAKERLTIVQLAEITGANRNTLKVLLRELVTTGRIRQQGKARATWYLL